MITRETLDELLEAQRKNHILIGEAMVKCGILTHEVKEKALKQFLIERDELEGDTGQ